MPPKTPEGKARALQNLKPFQRRRDSHGAYLIKPDQPETRAVADAIVAILQGEHIQLTQADEVTVGLLATVLRKVQRLDAYLEARGLVDRQGRPRSALELYLKLIKQAAELGDRLGLNPSARAKLGIDLGRGFSAVRELRRLAEQEEASSTGQMPPSQAEEVGQGDAAGSASGEGTGSGA